MFENNRPTTDRVRQDQAREGARRTLTVNKPKKPFVAKGHDAILKAHQDSGELIVVVMISGEVVNGKIVARDKFTITVHDTQGRKVTVYKHAIELFYSSIDKEQVQ